VREGKTMFRKLCFLFLTMAVSICLGVTAATADLVTFSDNISVQTLPYYTGTFDMYGGAGALNKIGVAFTALNSGSVSEIDLQITRRYEEGYGGYSGAFRVEIWADSNNLPGGTMPLYSSSAQTANAVYPGSPTTFNPATALQSISVTGLDLTSGTSYILVVVASELTSDIDWFRSSSAFGSTLQYYNNAWGYATTGTGANLPAFKIVGETTPVPIPAAVWLLGSGLIGLIGIRRFRK
jgi:hypothetical protein